MGCSPVKDFIMKKTLLSIVFMVIAVGLCITFMSDSDVKKLRSYGKSAVSYGDKWYKETKESWGVSLGIFDVDDKVKKDVEHVDAAFGDER